jgi:hypothetical protein
MVLMTQLVIVVVCAVLVALAILGWLVIIIRKKGPRRQTVFMFLLIPIAFSLVLIVGAILVTNSDAVKTERNHYTIQRIEAVYMEQCNNDAFNIYGLENVEFGFDARGNIVSWSHEEEHCELVTTHDWICTCPTPK